MESQFSHAMFLMLSDVLIPDYCFVNNDAPTCAYLRLPAPMLVLCRLLCLARCDIPMTVGALAETFSVGSTARAP